MAGKLSQIARYGCLLSGAVGWVAVAVAATAVAQERSGISSGAEALKNTDAENEPLRPLSGAVGPSGPRRVATSNHNPFAKLSKAPPVAPPIRPGSVSRWQRRSSLTEEPSALRAALLTTSAIEEKRSSWDQLPSDEQLQTSLFGQIRQASTSANTQFNIPTDPINFAPTPLAQPFWLTQENQAASPRPGVDQLPSRDTVSIDSFEVTGSTPAAYTSEPLTRAMITAGAPTEDALAGELPADADWLPIIVSDHADTPEDCYSQAQAIAKSAESVDQMTIVIEYCQRGLSGAPPHELALALRRLAAWAHNRRGELRNDAREQHDAFTDFQDAIRLDPNCWSAIHNRGITLAQQDQPSAALHDFNRVLELNPGLAVASRNRAELLASLGRMDEAIRDYTQALTQRPEDADLYRARGSAWQRLAAYDKALADLNRSLSLRPDQADVYTQRGNLSAELGNFDQALNNYQQALRIDSAWSEAHRSLAWFLSTCPDPNFRDRERALVEAEQASQLAPRVDCFVLDTLAAAHASAEQFDDAVRIQQEAISIAPSDVVAPLQERLALYHRREPFRTRSVAEAQPTLRGAPATNSAPSR